MLVGIETFQSSKAYVAGVAGLAGAVLQYFALPSVIDIPANLNPMFQYLTTGILVILILVGIISLRTISAQKPAVQAGVILAMLGLALITAVSFTTQLESHAHSVSCRDTGPQLILAPEMPSGDLRRETMRGGGIERGWCNHPNRQSFRAMVLREAIPDANKAGTKLLLAQLLFACAVILGLWMAMGKQAE